MTQDSLDKQVAGSHYRDLPMQPAEFVHYNRIPYLEGSVIYYVTRWRQKGGVEDLRKARHTLDMIIDMETKPTGLPCGPILVDSTVDDMKGE